MVSRIVSSAIVALTLWTGTSTRRIKRGKPTSRETGSTSSREGSISEPTARSISPA